MQHLIHRLATLGTLLTLLAACGGTATTSRSLAPQAVELAPQAAQNGSQPNPSDAQGEAASGGQGQGEAQDAPASSTLPFAQDPNRKIIKNGDVTLEVENASITTNRITTFAVAAGGYVLSVQSQGQSGQARSAMVSVAVPVDRFEAVMEQIRGAGVRVLSEQATGQDVSQEYVDLQSQLSNLEATQARIREFLSQAKTVEEALNVNAQLTEIEGQISQIKGRVQFLQQRAAYSTITAQLQELPPATPTPGPLATATATPRPTTIPWQLDDTVNNATNTLSTVAQSIASFAIWLGIVGVPLLLPFALGWLLFRTLRSRNRRPTPPISPPDAPRP